MVGVALEAAQELEGRGVRCEVINLRSLRPLDRECIVSSVKKTHYVMSVEGGWPQCGIGSEIAACIMESECVCVCVATIFIVSSWELYLKTCLERKDALFV